MSSPPTWARRPAAGAGYVNGFLLLTAALVLAALAALLIPAVRRDPITHEEPNVPLRHPEAALVAGGTLVGDDPGVAAHAVVDHPAVQLSVSVGQGLPSTNSIQTAKTTTCT